MSFKGIDDAPEASSRGSSRAPPGSGVPTVALQLPPCLAAPLSPPRRERRASARAKPAGSGRAGANGRRRGGEGGRVSASPCRLVLLHSLPAGPLRRPRRHGGADPGHQQAAGRLQHGGRRHHPAAADRGGRDAGEAAGWPGVASARVTLREAGCSPTPPRGEGRKEGRKGALPNPAEPCVQNPSCCYLRVTASHPPPYPVIAHFLPSSLITSSPCVLMYSALAWLPLIGKRRWVFFVCFFKYSEGACNIILLQGVISSSQHTSAATAGATGGRWCSNHACAQAFACISLSL